MGTEVQSQSPVGKMGIKWYNVNNGNERTPVYGFGKAYYML